MQTVTVKCKSCGAALKIDNESTIFTCEFCGTSLKLQKSDAQKAPDPSPSPQPDTSSSFDFQLSDYYTIVQNVKNNLKHISRLTKPFWIIACISIFIIVALSIFIPTIPSDSKTDYGEKINTGDNISRLPSNPMPPIVYSGTGDTVISGITLLKGNYYARLSHGGSRNFIVRFYYGDGQYDYTLLANKIGVYSGYCLLGDVLGAAVTGGSLDIKADGAWTITFYEISETAKAPFSASGDYVTGVIGGLSGRKTVTLSHTGSRNFIVRIYTYNAGKNGFTSAANKIGSYSGQISVTFKSDSNYYFTVQADGDWTISIT